MRCQVLIEGLFVCRMNPIDCFGGALLVRLEDTFRVLVSIFISDIRQNINNGMPNGAALAEGDEWNFNLRKSFKGVKLESYKTAIGNFILPC